MALSNKQRFVLTAVGVGIIVGLVVGGLGGYLGLPASVRGGLTGALIVVALIYLRKNMADTGSEE